MSGWKIKVNLSFFLILTLDVINTSLNASNISIPFQLSNLDLFFSLFATKNNVYRFQDCSSLERKQLI